MSEAIEHQKKSAKLIFLVFLLNGCAYIDVPTAVKFAYKDLVYPIKRSPAYHAATPTPTPRSLDKRSNS